ncbi:MAG: hypothetical protein KAS32_23970 [Candidatus Peribacteraceae bacterium]|nr:hypothetical protein [Candidatus Peribacteraceae bacterium]
MKRRKFIKSILTGSAFAVLPLPVLAVFKPKKSITPTLDMTGGLVVQGSNDGDTWTDIDVIQTKKFIIDYEKEMVIVKPKVKSIDWQEIMDADIRGKFGKFGNWKVTWEFKI